MTLNLTKQICKLWSSYLFLLCLTSLPSADAFPAAVQSAGEAAASEMVCTYIGPREEEGDSGHDDVGIVTSSAYLQLPPVEGPQDHLQEVASKDTRTFCPTFHF